MSYGDSALYTMLNDSSITSLLTKTSYVFNALVIPETDTDGASISSTAKTVNYYRSTPLGGGEVYLDVVYSVNCRADKQYKAEAIAKAVFDVVRGYSGSTHFVPSVLGPIPPQDVTDVFNVPVEIRTRGRTFN